MHMMNDLKNITKVIADQQQNMVLDFRHEEEAFVALKPAIVIFCFSTSSERTNSIFKVAK